MVRADWASGEAYFPIDGLLTAPSHGGRGKVALRAPFIGTLILFMKAPDFKTWTGDGGGGEAQTFRL